MIPAKFGSKNFEVSSKTIYTPNDISLSEELNVEETEVSGKKPTVNIKGIKLQSLDFDLKLDARFVDVEKERKFWRDTLLAKESKDFKLGNTNLGRFFLVKIETKNITINKDGKYTSTLLSLSFTEDGEYANTYRENSASPSKSPEIKVGSLILPKSGTRWYYTAEDALKKTGTSGKAYEQVMVVSYIYSKDGKVVCVNPQGLGWLKVEDVTVVTNTQPAQPKTNTSGAGTPSIASTTAKQAIAKINLL